MSAEPEFSALHLVVASTTPDRLDIDDIEPETDGWQRIRMTCADAGYVLGALGSLADAVVVESPADVAREITRRAVALRAP